METTSSPYCLYHKVAGIPVITAAAHKALETYESSKSYSALIAATCSLIESSLGFAAGKAQPVITNLQWPIELASKAACVGLDRLEVVCPAIKMTPDQLMDAGKDYYHKSYLNKGVGVVVASKDYGQQKVQLTKELCSCALTSSKNMMLYPVRVSGRALTMSVDMADTFVHKYIAEDNATKDHDYTKFTSNTTRLQNMGTKALTGVQVKAGRKLSQSREMLAQAFGDLNVALTLMESVRTAGDKVGQFASDGLVGVKGNAAALAQQIEAYAQKYDIQPDVMLLRWVKSSTQTLAAASSYVLKYSSTYLPDVCMHSLERTTQYLRELSIAVGQAQDLHELKSELVSETRERLVVMEQGLLQALDYAADYAPLKWLSWKKAGGSEPTTPMH